MSKVVKKYLEISCNKCDSFNVQLTDEGYKCIDCGNTNMYYKPVEGVGINEGLKIEELQEPPIEWYREELRKSDFKIHNLEKLIRILLNEVKDE